MPFSIHDLRYHLDESYPVFYPYIRRQAQRELGLFGNDPYEVDQVVDHVINQLTCLNLLGGGDDAPKTIMDDWSPARFHAYLNRMIRNKAIDQKRKRRFPMTLEQDSTEGAEEENDPLNDATQSLWGQIPFATPLEAALQALAQEESRRVLKHCIENLAKAPHQLQAVLYKLKEIGAAQLLKEVSKDLNLEISSEEDSPVNLSQHLDHAYKKLQKCLQRTSSHLGVLIAFRLTEYRVLSGSTNEIAISLQVLEQPASSEGEEGPVLSELEVRRGLKQLANEGLLNWHDEELVHFSSLEAKRLAHFYFI